jgi:hypothetical protein
MVEQRRPGSPPPHVEQCKFRVVNYSVDGKATAADTLTAVVWVALAALNDTLAIASAARKNEGLGSKFPEPSFI